MPSAEELAAADPSTDLSELARLAHEHPELRAAIAANPSTYDGLLEWLGQFRDPEIDAALARRRGVAAPFVAAVPLASSTSFSSSVPFSSSAPLASPDAAWHEPARDVQLRWATYPMRYGAGLGLLGIALFLPPAFVAQIGILGPALIQLVLSLVGIAMMPTTIGRRLGAGGILLPTLALPYLISFAFGGLLPAALPVLLALAIWLVLRQRPGITYLLLIAAALLGIAATYIVFSARYAFGYRELSLIEGLLQAVAVVGLAWLARLIHERVAVSRARRFMPEVPGQAVVAGQPVPGQPVYAQPGMPTNTMAILALVFGVGGGLLGIVFGHLARAQIRRTGEGGWALATVGLVLGYVGLGALVLLILVYAVIIGAALS